MRSGTRSRFGLAGAVALGVAVAIAVAVAVGLGGGPFHHAARSRHAAARARSVARLPAAGATAGAPRPTAVLTVKRPLPAPPLPVGFLGFSTEYGSIESYAGADPSALDPVLVRLIRGLTDGRPTVVRIGGDSADHTWWPVSGVSQPPGVSYSLDDRWLAVTRALRAAINAKLIMGVDLEAGSLQIAQAEAEALVRGLGPSNIRALELGNEPELYNSFPWYRVHHHGVTARPRGHYTLGDFTQEFAQFASVMPSVTIAGPTIGGPGWLKHLSQWLSDEPRVGLVTVHRYPLQSCFVKPSSPVYPTIARLLAPAASTGLADGFAPMIQIAHAHGLPIRIDELNSVSCGADPSVSYTFGAALWAVEALFEMDRIGAGGVNVHTFPGAGYELFKLSRADGRWRVSASPEYYGLLLFAQAAPPGSRLLGVEWSGGERGAAARAWAVRQPNGLVRLVLINPDPARAGVLALRVPQAGGSTATVWRLRAPGLAAASGVTLAGQSFDSSGTLSGRLQADRVAPADGRYVVRLPPASAALVTFGGNSARQAG